jgi:hypothetical protein
VRGAAIAARCHCRNQRRWRASCAARVVAARGDVSLLFSRRQCGTERVCASWCGCGGRVCVDAEALGKLLRLLSFLACPLLPLLRVVRPHCAFGFRGVCNPLALVILPRCLIVPTDGARVRRFVCSCPCGRAGVWRACGQGLQRVRHGREPELRQLHHGPSDDARSRGSRRQVEHHARMRPAAAVGLNSASCRSCG